MLDDIFHLTMFDSEPSSGGQVTRATDAKLMFANGDHLSLTLPLTKLHPSTPINLGLPWLRRVNPCINWTTMTISLPKCFSSATPFVQLVSAAKFRKPLRDC